MNWTYIVFSLLNLVGFITIGALMAYFVQRDWRKLKTIPSRRFIATAAIAAFVGGSLGVLINGMALVQNALGNMFFASVFAIFAIATISLTNKAKV
jgi:hypothetical protein